MKGYTVAGCDLKINFHKLDEPDSSIWNDNIKKIDILDQTH